MRLRRIGLLRHGLTGSAGRFCGSSNPRLSPAGWAQMERSVGGSRWDRIVTSPLTRCLEFATALACRADVPLAIDPRWAEMDFGDWEDVAPAVIWEIDPGVLERFWQNPLRHPPPNGEPFEPFCDRVLSGWMDVVRTREPRILVVSHGGPIRLLLSHIERHPLERLLDIDVDYGSLHLLGACDGRIVGTRAGAAPISSP